MRLKPLVVGWVPSPAKMDMMSEGREKELPGHWLLYLAAKASRKDRTFVRMVIRDHICKQGGRQGEEDVIPEEIDAHLAKAGENAGKTIDAIRINIIKNSSFPAVSEKKVMLPPKERFKRMMNPRCVEDYGLHMTFAELNTFEDGKIWIEDFFDQYVPLHRQPTETPGGSE